VVPGWSTPDRRAPDDLVDALRAAHRRGARIVSLCTGVFVLADAGLLEDRDVTTHWLYADRLAERVPTARIDARALFVVDGTVFTSAGTAAGLDLCLHLVALDHGAAVANAVARRIVMPPVRAGGQAQYIDRPLPATSDRGLGPLLDWAVANIGVVRTTSDLAHRANRSERSLRRAFHDSLGIAPSEWLAAVRLRAARELLETTDAGVAEVARRCGYRSVSALRERFGRELGVSPREYRRTFSARR
jgi:transcriptional regulator GlxA family with amidase domain